MRGPLEETGRAKRDARNPLPEGPGPEQRRAGRAGSPRGGPASAPPTPEEVFGYDAIYRSLELCMRGCSWKARPAWCWEHRAEFCAALSERLLTGEYEPRPTVSFEVARPKQRTILATDFTDRVVQRSLNDNLVYPAMSRPWIYDNCACQRGKGTDFARGRLHAHMERCLREEGGPPACLCVDVRGYYDHMAHDLTEARFARRLPPWAFDFVRRTLRHQYGSSGRGYKPGSQLVQIAGIDYLDPLDHLIKERLGARHYVRYMDDLVLLSSDEGFLRDCLDEIARQLSEVGMGPHPGKTRVVGSGAPVRFLGFDHMLGSRGRAYMLVDPAKVKQTRRDIAALARLAGDGRLTMGQARESWECRRQHISKGCSARTLDSLDEYVSRLVGSSDDPGGTPADRARR